MFAVVLFAVVLSDWSPERITLILGAIIPVVVALATFVHADAKVKAILTAVLAFIAGPLAVWIQTNQGFISILSGKNALFAWAVALATYLAGWKPIFQVNSTVGKYGLTIGKPKGQ